MNKAGLLSNGCMQSFGNAEWLEHGDRARTDVYYPDTTLQELKLQGTKIRDDVVLSPYSRNKWFANNLSTFWTGEQPAP